MGSIQKIISVGKGEGATDGVAWGDYSSTIIDGDNLMDLGTIQSMANIKGMNEAVIVKVPFTKK